MRPEVIDFATELMQDFPSAEPPPAQGSSKDLLLLPSAITPISEAAAEMFKRMAASGRFFIRGSLVQELTRLPDGRLALASLKPAALRSRIEKFGQTAAVVLSKTGTDTFIRPKRASEADCRALLETSEAREFLPPITLVSNAPVLIHDASSLRTLNAGYHAAGGGILVCRSEVRLDICPGAAAEALNGLLDDFLFATPADLSRALALLLTPALNVSGIIPGRSPVFLVEANNSQTGKGYLLNVVSCIYDEQPSLVAQKRGGVGSFDESLQQALLAGRPFILIDNLRGRVDSPFLEAVLTSPAAVGCRVPYAGETEVDVSRFNILATSNGVELTEDLARRTCVVRLRKQPEDYDFREYDEGDLIQHVRAHSAYYLGCVHSIIRAWYEAGAVVNRRVRHDFRAWAGVVESILQTFWPDSTPLFEGHSQVQMRAANPDLVWLRHVAIAVQKAGRLGAELTASEIVTLCRTNNIEIRGYDAQQGGDHGPKCVGIILHTVMTGEILTIDDVYQMTRAEKWASRYAQAGHFAQKVYTFSMRSI